MRGVDPLKSNARLPEVPYNHTTSSHLRWFGASADAAKGLTAVGEAFPAW